MKMEQLVLLGAGALGGFIYAAVGWWNNFRTAEGKCREFDAVAFLTPLLYGTVAGAIAVYLTPVGGVSEAIAIGTSGTYILKKLLNSEVDTAAVTEKIASLVK